MTAIHLDSPHDDAERRRRLYDGDIYLFSPRPSTCALIEFAAEQITEAFAPRDPVEAQFVLPVEEFVSIVAALQPRFIHHPTTKQLIRDVIDDLGCDLDKVYFDVPRMRVQSHGGYLRAGVGYALHPHRDTWYSAPLSQLNWWSAVFPFEAESAMTFYPQYFDRSVANGSSDFDLYTWNAHGRKNAADQLAVDTRKQPRPEEPLDLRPEVRLVLPPGGVVLFSGAHLHATVPNESGRTRFSVDFRTVHEDDVREMGGAPNVDSRPIGTTLWAHLRGTDLETLPPELVALYDPNPPEGAVLVYQPDA